jgi:CRISPR-associated endonuclease/helicase Cas3
LPPDRLLAKSGSPTRGAQTLASHTADVLRAARGIVRACGPDLVRAFVLPAELYHSRYRYRDRVARHGAVIGAFRGTGPAAVVATQVCEQSLDLDADLLVTELAPVWALIQRLGRLNRFASPDGSAGLRDCLVVEPTSPLPYLPEDLDRARRWVGALTGRGLSQRDLARAWEDVGQPAEEPESGVHAWLDGGSRPAPTRSARPAPGCSTCYLRTPGWSSTAVSTSRRSRPA